MHFPRISPGSTSKNEKIQEIEKFDKNEVIPSKLFTYLPVSFSKLFFWKALAFTESQPNVIFYGLLYPNLRTHCEKLRTQPNYN